MIVDTFLKLVTIKSLTMNKSYNCKMMSTTKKLVNQFSRTVAIFEGAFLADVFFRTP